MSNEILKKGKSNGVYVLENVRIAYPYFWEPSTFYENAKGESQYGCEIIFTKDSALDNSFSQLLKSIGEQHFGQVKYRVFILDGDSQKDINGMPSDNPKEYRMGCKYFKVKSKRSPSVYTELGEKLEIDNGDIYGGCICRVFISVYSFNTPKLKGLGFNLIGIQKIKDAERISSGSDYDISQDIEILSLPETSDTEDLIF